MTSQLDCRPNCVEVVHIQRKRGGANPFWMLDYLVVGPSLVKSPTIQQHYPL